MDAVFEHLEPLGEAEPRRHGLDNIQIDAAGPHAGLSAFFGRLADQRRAGRADLVQVLADRGDLGEHHPIIQRQRRALTGWVTGQERFLPVRAGADVDGLSRNTGNAPLGHEHAYDLGIGAD